jgi:hypothetical protein
MPSGFDANKENVCVKRCTEERSRTPADHAVLPSYALQVAK